MVNQMYLFINLLGIFLICIMHVIAFILDTQMDFHIYCIHILSFGIVWSSLLILVANPFFLLDF